MIPPHTPVQLDKLSAENTPEGMLPTGYWLRGALSRPIVVGQTIHVWRTSRAAREPGEVSPVLLAGEYESSPVRTITEHEDGSVTVATVNSTWRVTPLPRST